jgi:uncharacterized membrane protein YczE
MVVALALRPHFFAMRRNNLQHVALPLKPRVSLVSIKHPRLKRLDMWILIVAAAIGLSFVRMPSVAHTAITLIIVAIGILYIGVGSCAGYVDEHLRPGSPSLGKQAVFHGVVIVFSRLVGRMLAGDRSS